MEAGTAEVVVANNGSSSSSASPVGSEQGAMSDGSSSQSSLAARVAQLLQSQSSTTMVSSRTSSSDLEESRAREWLKLKVSGQRCGPLELDTEDRMRIEEIKRELLLHTKHTLKSQGSTDTESSAFSSLGGPGVQPSSQPVGPGVQPSSQLVGPSNALRAAEDRLSHQLQSLSRNPFNASAPLNTRPDLEARVREIAQREGLSFPGPRPPPLTSITIATCRRSLTPSPSPSSLPTPEPLHLNQLSPEPLVPPASQALSPSLHTQVDEGTTVTLETSGYPARSEPDSSLNARHQDFADSQSDSGFQQGRKASGSQSDLRALSQGSQMEEAIARHDVPTRRDQEEASCGHPVSPTPSKYGQISCSYANAGSPGAGLGRSTDGVFSSVTRSPAKLGHVSRVHLTLSPKVTDQALASDPSSGHPALGTWLPAAEFAPFGHSSTVSGGLAGGLSHTPQSLLSNQERCQQGREPVGVQTARVPEPTTAFKYPRAFTPPQRLAGPPRPSTVRVPVPLLLPYKPHGSEELFYMPQTEARLSTMPQTEARLAPLPQTEARLPPMLQTETRLSTMPQTEARLPLMPQSEAQLSPIRSDTTVESSHPGSDDAVPPRFSAEVLGSRDQEEDHGVAIRHTEGIYSKRLKEPSRNMQAAHTGGVESADRGSQTSEWRSSQASTQSADVLTRRRPSSGHRVPADHMRDRGTSPNVPDIPGQRSPSSSLREDMEEFQPLRGEMDYSMDDQHSHPIAGALPPDYGRRRDPALAKATSQPAESHLDDLWRRFSERWGAQEELRLPSEREASLLERLERLSRLIHSTDGSPSPSGAGKNTVEVPDPTSHEPRGRREGAVETEGRRQAWGPQEAQEEPQAGGAEEEEGPASASSGASLSRHLCPAERDESGETSSCTSTVDTVRLVRAFGSHRVRGLKTDSGRGLGKLYSAIGKQREGKEQRRGRGARARDTPAAVLSEIARTDDSRVTADSASSSSTYTLPTGRGPAHFFPAKKPVKLVSKSIQTGDLEIVSNGTRRHTRDVGTTFPSPGLARGSKLPSSSHSSSSSIGERGKGVPERSPPKAQTFLRERKSKGRRSLAKHYPQGVSWFVPADDLRAESRKENQPETAAVPKPGPAWFQPYSRTRPWREPLRQRQVREDLDHNQTTRPLVISEPQPELSGKPSSALVRITLQEALEMRRPEFVSGSRERLKRLALKVEERKLQAVFSRERDELFNRPGGPGRLPKPAGTALFKRAVPKKEMVQRSKQIYSQLPEVQKRREEERRKAEYRSYRLNAQLYNKRITNHVLGKRTPWQ